MPDTVHTLSYLFSLQIYEVSIIFPEVLGKGNHPYFLSTSMPPTPDTIGGFRERSHLEVAIYWKVCKVEEEKVEDFPCNSASRANICLSFAYLFRSAAGDCGWATPPSYPIHHHLHIKSRLDISISFPSFATAFLSLRQCFFPYSPGLSRWSLQLDFLFLISSTSSPFSTLLLIANVLFHLCL